MKSTLLALGVSLLALPATQAQAAVLYFEGDGTNEIVTLHTPYAISDNVESYAGQELISFEGQEYVSWCVDLTKATGTGTAVEVSSAGYPHANWLAYLYWTYAPEATTPLKAAALQTAIWEVLTETSPTLDALSGTFWISGNDAVADAANALLATLPPENWQPGEYPMILQSDSVQNLMIPEPATATLAAAGLALLLSRRRVGRRRPIS